jgi:predicted nuclease of predicted toxin-antitoxin system
MDENVQGPITEGLRRRRVDVLTVQEDGRRRAPDPKVLDRATELGRVLFSQDEDLLVEASSRQAAGVPFSGVIYAHQLRVSVGQCIDELEVAAGVMEPDEMHNQIMYIPLR